MKTLFGTSQWFDAFMERLGADPLYKEVAKNYEGDIVFTCLAQPDAHEILENDLKFYFEPYHGEIKQWRTLENGDDPQAAYFITAKYPVWKDVAEGRVNLKKAVLMTRKIKVKGKISRLMKHMKAAERVLEVLSEMREDFDFPDEV